jgi:hypothetical protein
MKYFKILMLCFFLASALSLIGVYLLQSTGLIGTVDTDFKNLPYGIAIGVNVGFLITSLPILLNLIDRVKTNRLYHALSFFLLPAIFLLFLRFAMWDEPWPGLLFLVPHPMVLIIFFLYSKRPIV